MERCGNTPPREGRGCGGVEGIPGGGKFKGKGLEVGQRHLSWEWLLSRAGVVAEPWDPRLALRDVLRRLVFLGGPLESQGE